MPIIMILYMYYQENLIRETKINSPWDSPVSDMIKVPRLNPWCFMFITYYEKPISESKSIIFVSDIDLQMT